MLVSIIIPIYKVEPYIIRCIDSVLHQSYREIEVILVDDCSPDKSMAMARDCIEQSPLSKDLQFIYLRHKNNRGLSAARNTGIKSANGQYVFFLDSDDEITPDCISLLINSTNKFEYDMIIGDYHVINKNREYPPLKLERGAISSKDEILNDYSSGNWYMMAWNKLYRLRMLNNKHLLFKEGLIHEDELWSFQIACTINNMYVVNNLTYNYYINENSITTAQTLNRRLHYYNIILKEMYIFQTRNKIFQYNVERLILCFIKRIYNNSKNIDSKYKFYKKIRKCDSRKLSDKLKAYPGVILKIKYFDFFINPFLGYLYRYCFWNAMKFKTRNKQLPFIY